MTDYPEREPYEAVFERATHAAFAKLPGGSPATVEDTAQALRAAADVFDTDKQQYADQLVAATKIAGFNLDGRGTLELVLAHELAATMTLSFRTILDAQPGAENYVEQEVVERSTGERYVFIVCKPGGKTPHQLRRDAEAERDALRAEVERLRAAVADIADRQEARAVDGDNPADCTAMLEFADELREAIR